MPEARTLSVEAWQHTCPQCGYENGFHVSFRKVSPADAKKAGSNEVAIWLICPSCSSLFDIGQRVRLSEGPKA